MAARRCLAMHILVPILCLLAPAAAPAQTITIEPIRVGVIDAPPYAMRDAADVHTGLAVDLFRLVAEEADLSARLESVTDPVAALRDGVDVVLPVEGSPALEEAADLTHPVYTATLGAAAERPGRVMSVLRGFASIEFLRLLAGLSALLLLVGAAVWLIERRRNTDMFHREPVKGLGDGFWWAGVTLTTIGYGDKAPVTFFGRAVAMLWMLVGLAVSASLTAAVVALADGSGAATLSVPVDLEDRRVAVITDGTAAAYAERQGLTVLSYPDAAAAIAAVEAGEAAVALGSAPALRHETEGTTLRVTTTEIDPILIAFATAEGSPYREELDRAILRIITSEAGQDVVRRYLGDG